MEFMKSVCVCACVLSSVYINIPQQRNVHLSFFLLPIHLTTAFQFTLPPFPPTLFPLEVKVTP